MNYVMTDQPKKWRRRARAIISLTGDKAGSNTENIPDPVALRILTRTISKCKVANQRVLKKRGKRKLNLEDKSLMDMAGVGFQPC